MRRLIAILILLATLGSGGAAAAVLRGHLARPHRGTQVRLSPYTIGPESEREVCQLVTLRNARAFDASEIDVSMPGSPEFGTHHFAIFLDVRDTPAPPQPEPVSDVGCTGMGGAFVPPLLAFVQHPRERIRFPLHVGVRLKPHQRLFLNSHYINGSAAPITIDVAVNFRAARKGSVQHHARSFQLGTFDIDVPPGAEGSAVGSWTTPFPINVIALSSHSHKHTQSVTVDLLRAGVSAGQQLLTTDYADPSVHSYDPPLRLEAGDGWRWTCNYLNMTPGTVRFGVTSNDEMCFATGFFYIDDDAAPLPPVPGCFGQGESLTCPFS